MGEKGLTLIEIIVVIVVIAIIGAFVTMSLVNLNSACGNCGYEVSAQRTMKNLCEVQSTWRKKDLDRNGQQDYWCLDVAGLFYALDIYGDRLQYVDISTAKADPLVATNWATASGIDVPYSSNDNGNRPRNGYFFSVLTTNGDGEPYLQTTTTADLDGPYANIFDGKKEVKVGNKTKFGFIAWPSTYGSTGNNFYIVNQSTNIYSRDTGDNSGDNGAKIPLTQWPASEAGVEEHYDMTSPWIFVPDD